MLLFINLPHSFNLDWQMMYQIGACYIGICICYMALSLKKQQGKSPKNSLFQMAYLSNAIWLFITGFALFHFKKLDPLTKVLSSAYLLYYVVGWFYSTYLLKDQIDKIHDIDDLIMPNPYINYEFGFSVMIVLSSLGILLTNVN